MMSLTSALHVLCRVHTRDDGVTGFRIEMGATPHEWLDCSHHDYVEAWKAVRHAIGMPIGEEVPPSPAITNAMKGRA